MTKTESNTKLDTSKDKYVIQLEKRISQLERHVRKLVNLNNSQTVALNQMKNRIRNVDDSVAALVRARNNV